MSEPVITGFNVLKEVRKFSSVPIIVFTAQLEAVERAAGSGADDWIIKPVDPDILVEEVRKLLSNHPIAII